MTSILNFVGFFDWDVFTFTFVAVLGAMLAGLGFVLVCHWLGIR